MKQAIKQIGRKVLTWPPLYRHFQRRALHAQPVTILCYHTLRADNDPLESWLALRMGDFAAQVTMLQKTYDIVSLDAALRPAEKGQRPRAVLTFDDGERAMHDLLLPFVEQRQLPVTIYVATGQIESGQPYWFDRVINALQGPRRVQIDLRAEGLGQFDVGGTQGKARWDQIAPVLEALKTCPEGRRDELADKIVGQVAPQDIGLTPAAPMTPAQLQRVATSPFVTIGAHTHGHELLDQLPLDQARASIARSQELLTTWTGQAIRHFAYPNGNYTPALMRCLEDLGFASATILEDRLAGASDPLRALPRISVGRFDALRRLQLRLVGI